MSAKQLDQVAQATKTAFVLLGKLIQIEQNRKQGHVDLLRM